MNLNGLDQSLSFASIFSLHLVVLAPLKTNHQQFKILTRLWQMHIGF